MRKKQGSTSGQQGEAKRTSGETQDGLNINNLQPTFLAIKQLSFAMITNLDFSDDVVIFAETLEVLEPTLDTQNSESELLRLNVSWIKTKIQKFVALFDEDKTSHHRFLNKENLGIDIDSGGTSFPVINRQLRHQ